MNRVTTCIIIAAVLMLGKSLTIDQQEGGFNSIESLAQQMASQTSHHQYDVKTVEGFNVDCLKAIKTKN